MGCIGPGGPNGGGCHQGVMCPVKKGTVILEKTVLVIYKIYDVILRTSKVEREHKAPARHLTF